MEDFNLILKNLISKNIEEINTKNLTDDVKIGFEKTAEKYVFDRNYLDAIKVFVLTGNISRLKELGDFCLKINKLYESFYAFYYSDIDKLNKVGEEFLKIPDIENALKCFKKSGNKEMTEFIQDNLIN